MGLKWIDCKYVNELRIDNNNNDDDDDINWFKIKINGDWNGVLIVNNKGNWNLYNYKKENEVNKNWLDLRL